METYSYPNDEIDNEVEKLSELKMCELCRKPYKPKGRNASRSKVCERVHYRICPICGTEFVLTNLSDLKSLKKCCSRKCSNKLKGLSTKQTMLDKYGVENPSQVKEFRSKAVAGIKEKQDVIQSKRRKTMVERYGVEYPMQSKDFKEKIAETNRERYGYSNPSQNIEIRKKISERLKDPEVQAHYLERAMRHYRVKQPSMTLEVQEKMKATSLERYGVEYPIQNDEIKSIAAEHQIQSVRGKYEVDYISQVPEVKEKARKSFIEKYGVACSFQVNPSFNTVSKINQSFGEWLEDLGLEVEYEFQLENRRYDLHIVDTNILIEINPTYTHNAYGNHWGIVRDQNYHLSKTELAEKHGYRCIHIFDWDNLSKIVSMFFTKSHIGARKLRLDIVGKWECDEFLNQYHLQGTCRGQDIRLGLYLDNELIQVMTFGAPRYNSNYEYELLRLCTDPTYIVSGGAEKLFCNFIETYSPKSILSYCDYSKFSGQVYSRLGFELTTKNSPSKIWSKDNKKITDNLLRQRGFDQIFHTNYGKGTSNEELMLDHGWLPVYDCGQFVYTLYKNRQ